MSLEKDVPKTLQAISAAAERRAEEIRAQRRRIDAARVRLWERMDRMRQLEPGAFSAPPAALLIPAGEPVDALTDPRLPQALAAADPMLLALAEAERTLADLAAEAAG